MPGSRSRCWLTMPTIPDLARERAAGGARDHREAADLRVRLRRRPDRGKRPYDGAPSPASSAELVRSSPTTTPAARIPPPSSPRSSSMAVDDRHRARPRALRIALAVAPGQRGDVVVGAGKGHEQGQQFADRTLPFDDRAVARAALEAVPHRMIPLTAGRGGRGPCAAETAAEGTRSPASLFRLAGQREARRSLHQPLPANTATAASSSRTPPMPRGAAAGPDGRGGRSARDIVVTRSAPDRPRSGRAARFAGDLGRPVVGITGSARKDIDQGHPGRALPLGEQTLSTVASRQPQHRDRPAADARA